MDFATVISPLGVFDWAIVNGDLASDGGLDTAVALSLFTDRVAHADDVLPDNSGDRRGWWGDAYLPPRADGTPDHIGSRLWVHLTRALQTQETAVAAQGDVEEALAWIQEDGIGTVTVPLPTYPGPGLILIQIAIAQQTSAGVVSKRYETLWDMTRGAPSSFGIVQG